MTEYDPPEEGHDAEPPGLDDPHGGEMPQVPVPVVDDTDTADEDVIEYPVDDADEPDADEPDEPEEADDQLADNDDQILDVDPEEADG